MKHQAQLEALALEARSHAQRIYIAARAGESRWIADRAARLAADCAELLAELRALDSEPRSPADEVTQGGSHPKPELLGAVVERVIDWERRS